MDALSAIEVQQLTHHYGRRRALDDVTFAVTAGEIFAFLGPNGGGKTTLFRILSTLVAPQTGRVVVLGSDVTSDTLRVRRALGVVFQSPSLDKKLTVRENLNHQAALYGIDKRGRRQKQDDLLTRLGLTDRANDIVETLSGGLQRRVELAKGMLHGPKLLLMDEPSTGLDPGARSDLWRYLRRLRDEESVTIVMTTHLLEEADRADRIAILHEGRLVAHDTPANLRSSVGGDSLTVQAHDPAALASAIADRFACGASVVDGVIRLDCADAASLVGPLWEAFPDQLIGLRLGHPTLEDVFIQRTGHRFWRDAGGVDRDIGRASARKSGTRERTRE
ncbi:MAG: ABC transporter ATP-binding protein [Pirellulaceae bacterium]